MPDTILYEQNINVIEHREVAKMVLHTVDGLLKVAIVASTVLGGAAARPGALASFYQYLARAGVTCVIHLGQLLGSSWRPTIRHPLLDYPAVTGVTTFHYPAACPGCSPVGALMHAAGRDDWVELTEPRLDVIGPDGTAVKCHLVLDPVCARFAAAMSVWTVATRRSFREFSGGYYTVPPDSLFLFGGNPRPAIRRNVDGRVLIQSGSRFHGPGATAAILTLPIEPAGLIRDRECQLETWYAA
jgi:hypothetical protein